MTFASASQLHVYLPWGLNSVLNVKALVGAFNQEKALVGAFSVITNLRMELFQALVTTQGLCQYCGSLQTYHVATCDIVEELHKKPKSGFRLPPGV